MAASCTSKTMVIGGMPIFSSGPWRRVIFFMARSILRTSPWLMGTATSAASVAVTALSVANTGKAKAVPSTAAISNFVMLHLL
ncbi:hypothetical protein D9M68_608940 [compost metagenome]